MSSCTWLIKPVYRIGIEAPGFGRINRIPWPDTAGFAVRMFPDSLAGSFWIPWSDMTGALGPISPDCLVRCFRILRSDVIGFIGRMFSDSLAKCRRNSHHILSLTKIFKKYI
jgi:hypothetical protein